MIDTLADVKLWQWRKAIAGSTLPAMTKAVLHALGTFMDGDGFAFPAIATVAQAASVTERCAGHHLRLAALSGWVLVADHGRSGQGWRRNSYQTSVPVALAHLIPELPGTY